MRSYRSLSGVIYNTGIFLVIKYAFIYLRVQIVHHRHRGGIAALTPVPVELHQHYIILHITELTSQTGSVVLLVMKGLDGYSTFTENLIPLSS